MITLEMIDHVMDITGKDYAAVRAALLATDGDMDQAIHNLQGGQSEPVEDIDHFTLVERLQEELGISWTEAKELLVKANWNYNVALGVTPAEEATENTEKAEDPWRAKRENLEIRWEQIWETIQDFAKRGLATKLIIRKEGKDAININLGLGVLGVVAAPFATIAGLGAALFTDYKVLIELHDGRVINLIDLVTDREKGQEDTSWNKYREPSVEEDQTSDESDEDILYKPEVTDYKVDPVKDPRDPHA